MQIYEQENLILKTGRNEWEFQVYAIVPTCFTPVFIWEGYRFNRESWAPNTPDVFPSGVHDIGYEFKVDAFGTRLTRLEWDVIFFVLNRKSHCEENQRVASRNYRGVRVGGLPFWSFPLKTPQIPVHAECVRMEMVREWVKTDGKEVMLRETA